MSSKWSRFHVDPTEESLLKFRLKMLGMALKKLYRITLKKNNACVNPPLDKVVSRTSRKVNALRSCERHFTLLLASLDIFLPKTEYSTFRKFTSIPSMARQGIGGGGVGLKYA